MNANDVFWLARYAHNTLDPLFKEAQQIEPTIKYAIEMNFYTPDVPFTGRVGVYAHWKRPGMFQYTYSHETKADIDQLAGKIKADVAKLKADALLPA